MTHNDKIKNFIEKIVREKPGYIKELGDDPNRVKIYRRVGKGDITVFVRYDMLAGKRGLYGSSVLFEEAVFELGNKVKKGWGYNKSQWILCVNKDNDLHIMTMDYLRTAKDAYLSEYPTDFQERMIESKYNPRETSQIIYIPIHYFDHSVVSFYNDPFRSISIPKVEGRGMKNVTFGPGGQNKLF